MDEIMAVLLRTGVLLSAGLVFIGGIIFLVRHPVPARITACFRASRRKLRTFGNSARGREISRTRIDSVGAVVVDCHAGGAGAFFRVCVSV